MMVILSEASVLSMANPKRERGRGDSYTIVTVWDIVVDQCFDGHLVYVKLHQSELVPIRRLGRGQGIHANDFILVVACA